MYRHDLSRQSVEAEAEAEIWAQFRKKGFEAQPYVKASAHHSFDTPMLFFYGRRNISSRRHPTALILAPSRKLSLEGCANDFDQCVRSNDLNGP